ncbi:MAG TPA: hypothetical protein VGJ87_13405 [Roseiflexaceae bacterium]|jgi:hypothetical protein
MRPQRLAGILALSDIVRIQARIARVAGGQRGAPPALSEVQETLADQPVFRRLRKFGSAADLQDGDTERAPRYHTVMLAPDAPAVGLAVQALDLPRGVLLITIERDHQTLIPKGGRCSVPATC